MKTHGKCLCGKVKVELELSNKEVAACHCSMCRTWSGSPMMAIECDGSISFSGETSIAKYQSSDWAERGFCQHCGTHLYYLLKPANQYHIPAGLLGDLSGYHFSHQIFIDEKPEYYSFANKTTNMTGAEVFAHFADGE